MGKGKRVDTHKEKKIKNKKEKIIIYKLSHTNISRINIMHMILPRFNYFIYKLSHTNTIHILPGFNSFIYKLSHNNIIHILPGFDYSIYKLSPTNIIHILQLRSDCLVKLKYALTWRNLSIRNFEMVEVNCKIQFLLSSF